MTCWVIVPLKAARTCKTRLRGVLDDSERRALVRQMARHVVETARTCAGVDRVAIVGPERHGLDATVPLIEDRGAGLNAALADALALAASHGPTRVIILPGDLPLLTVEDVAALAFIDGLGIAPDRAGTGTNGLSLPTRTGFRPAFGPASFVAHCAEAARLGLAAHVVRSPTLALDIDVLASLQAVGTAGIPRKAA
jgi:2-phospho-L-lactate/phosphoenolpyruvate guanylyltransferase